MPTDDQEGLAKDLEATIAARAELGRDYEPALVESFAERLEQTIERRVDAEVKRHESPPGSGHQLAVAIVSLGTGIPITAIASGEGLPGLVVAWCGIVGVNMAHALSRRHRR